MTSLMPHRNNSNVTWKDFIPAGHGVEPPKDRQVSEQKVIRKISQAEITPLLPINRNLAGVGGASILALAVAEVSMDAAPLIDVLAVTGSFAALGVGCLAYIWNKASLSPLSFRYGFADKNVSQRPWLPWKQKSIEAKPFLININNHEQGQFYPQSAATKLPASATHEVKTTLTHNWLGSKISQTISPVSLYLWDDSFEKTLAVNSIADLPAIDFGEASLAIQRVRAGSRSMEERLLEIENITGKGTTKWTGK